MIDFAAAARRWAGGSSRSRDSEPDYLALHLEQRQRLSDRIAEMASQLRALAEERDRLADGLAWANWWLEREEAKVPGTCPECGLWAGAPPGYPLPPPDWWLGCLLCWWDFQRGLI